ncbi:IS3 family transposase [Persicitalea jodogahamensis]|uniref:IS3 family transposase n=1 Tax=Persicitalea jodogahamensis TaxID=402147 RepID=UPI0027E48E83|nr:IS3 family transposase [Persicitalea jodogahamensis]
MLGASRTAYYRYRRGGSYQPTARREEKKLLVESVFGEHKRRYGSRRITAELRERGHELGRYQVRSLMKASGLRPIQPKSFVPRTTDSTHKRGYCGTAHAAQPAAGSAATRCP